MLFSVIPIVNFWAAYRVEKLIKALVIFILSSLAVSFLVPFPFSLPIIIVIEVYFMRRWSIQWNKKINNTEVNQHLT
jgi:hypothetical protein